MKRFFIFLIVNIIAAVSSSCNIDEDITTALPPKIVLDSENGIYTTYRYYPLHRVPGYGATGNFPNADYAADNTLNLPIHQSISTEELNYILEKVKVFDEKFCK